MDGGGWGLAGVTVMVVVFVYDKSNKINNKIGDLGADE